jgi:hypothetical protein
MMDRRRQHPPHMAPPPAASGHGVGAGKGGEGERPAGRPGQVGAYEDVTGQFTVPEGPAYYGAPPAYLPVHGAPTAANGLTRDTWVRIIIWVVPLIFMAGTLYFNLQTTVARQEALEERVRLISDRVSAMASDARVLQEHVMALRAAGDRIQPQLDGLREQLSGLRSDLAAIREKLGIAGAK